MYLLQDTESNEEEEEEAANRTMINDMCECYMTYDTNKAAIKKYQFFFSVCLIPLESYTDKLTSSRLKIIFENSLR